MIHINQYGFLKDMVIQDCLGWSYEYIHQCLKSKEEMLVLKLDFEKAFDTIEHQAIIDILRAKGFGNKWISWIQMIFKYASNVVLLNGVLGKKLWFETRVTRGPLIPTTGCFGCRHFTISDQQSNGDGTYTGTFAN